MQLQKSLIANNDEIGGNVVWDGVRRGLDSKGLEYWGGELSRRQEAAGATKFVRLSCSCFLIYTQLTWKNQIAFQKHFQIGFFRIKNKIRIFLGKFSYSKL